VNHMTMREIRSAIRDKATRLGLNFLNRMVCHIKIGTYSIARFGLRAATSRQFEVDINIDCYSGKFIDEVRKRIINGDPVIKRFNRNQCGVDDMFKFLASIYTDGILRDILNGSPIGDPIPLPLMKEPAIIANVCHAVECNHVGIVGVVAISNNRVDVKAGSDVIMTPGQKTWMLIAIRGGAIITDGEVWYSAAQVGNSTNYFILNKNVFNFKFTGWDTEIIRYIVRSYLG